MQPEQLPETVRAFLNGEIYPHPAENICCHETHISWVFLAGEFAYKIKKPVNLGFVDFSSLASRKRYCEAEIRLNRRLAPDLYLGVVAFTGTSAAPTFAGEGEAWEYAVKMQRFPETALLTHPACTAQLTSPLWQAFAERIATFHQAAAQAPVEKSWGTSEAVLQVVTDNFAPIRRVKLFDEQEQSLQVLERWIDQQFPTLAPLIKQRKTQGLVRECHGDLHLQNLVLLTGKITAFDGIEFNDSFRWIDPINEVAFLTMDLQERELETFSAVFLSTYLQQTGDYQSLELLPFYQVYRALVRAKVNAIRLSQQEWNKESPQIYAELSRYLQLAVKLTQPAPPQLFLMMGVSGTGKSTVAQQMVEELGVVCLRSDYERKRLYEQWPTLGPLKWPAELPDDPYSSAGMGTIYEWLRDFAAVILQAGFSVVVDATFLKREHRQLFLRLAEKCQVKPTIVHLEAPDTELQQRLAERSQQPGNLSDANADVLRLQRSETDPFTADELPHVVEFSTDLPLKQALVLRE